MFWRIQTVYVISLIFVKKVLTKHDIVCYNNQAVSETGNKNLEDRQQANLENDTEETRTRGGAATIRGTGERGSRAREKSEFYE